MAAGFWEKLVSLDRRWIYLVIGIVTFFPILFYIGVPVNITTEVEAVIKALEEIDIETTGARKFAFTSSHDTLKLEGMDDNPNQYGHISSLFQWEEDGSLVPIYPKWLMEEAGVSYTFPPWSGPWDNIS